MNQRIVLLDQVHRTTRRFQAQIRSSYSYTTVLCDMVLWDSLEEIRKLASDRGLAFAEIAYIGWVELSVTKFQTTYSNLASATKTAKIQWCVQFYLGIVVLVASFMTAVTKSISLRKLEYSAELSNVCNEAGFWTLSRSLKQIHWLDDYIKRA